MTLIKLLGFFALVLAGGALGFVAGMLLRPGCVGLVNVYDCCKKRMRRLSIGGSKMGLRAVSISQNTLDRLQLALGDDIAVESVNASEDERASELVGLYRCRSEAGGEIVLCVQRCDEYPPFELLCTLEFAGWSFSRKHQSLYRRVADRLQEQAKAEGESS